MPITVQSIVVLLFVFIGTFPARGNPVMSFDVADLVNRALKRSDLLTAHEKAVESSRFSSKQAAVLQNPSVSFSVGNKFASGKSGFSYDAVFAQPFYFPGKQKASIDIAVINEKIAGLTLSEARLFVQYSVIRLSYQYAMAEELSYHIEGRIERFNLIRKYIASRSFASPKNRIDRHIVEMKLSLFSKNLDEVRASKDVVLAKLNLFIGMNEKFMINAPWFEIGSTMDMNELRANVEKGNLDVKKQSIILERIKTEARLARLQAYPDFNVSFLYREDRAPDTERFIGAGVSFSIPLWNRNESGIKSMESSIEGERARAAHSRRAAEQDLLFMVVGYETAKKNLERLNLSQLDDLHLRMSDADDAFNKGLIDLLSYFELESQSFEMHLAVFSAQYEYIDKYTALQILQGREDFNFPAFSEKTRRSRLCIKK